MKQRLKSGDEVDVVLARKWYNFPRGFTKRVKRALNKRIRKEGRENNER